MSISKDDFVRLVNDGTTDDIAYVKKEQVIAIAPRVDPKYGVVRGAAVVLAGGLTVGVAKSIEEVAALLGIAHEPLVGEPAILVES